MLYPAVVNSGFIQTTAIFLCRFELALPMSFVGGCLLFALHKKCALFHISTPICSLNQMSVLIS